MAMPLLKVRRETAQMTQQQVANALNINQTAISQWETGITKPRAERLIQLARLYGCTVDELLAEEDGGKSA